MTSGDEHATRKAIGSDDRHRHAIDGRGPATAIIHFTDDDDAVTRRVDFGDQRVAARRGHATIDTIFRRRGCRRWRRRIIPGQPRHVVGRQSRLFDDGETARRLGGDRVPRSSRIVDELRAGVPTHVSNRIGDPPLPRPHRGNALGTAMGKWRVGTIEAIGDTNVCGELRRLAHVVDNSAEALQRQRITFVAAEVTQPDANARAKPDATAIVNAMRLRQVRQCEYVAIVGRSWNRLKTILDLRRARHPQIDAND